MGLIVCVKWFDFISYELQTNQGRNPESVETCRNVGHTLWRPWSNIESPVFCKAKGNRKGWVTWKMDVLTYETWLHLKAGSETNLTADCFIDDLLCSIKGERYWCIHVQLKENNHNRSNEMASRQNNQLLF